MRRGTGGPAFKHGMITSLAVLPFVLMLAAIALGPAVAPHWWESNRNRLLVSLVLGLPVAMVYLARAPATLAHALGEYAAFIAVLGALYVIAGGIVLHGDLRATPLVNAGFLAVGAILASLVGTTGAAMLLIRPLLRTNRERTRVTHTVVFFIFIVANVGGLLTPLGDPPLTSPAREKRQDTSLRQRPNALGLRPFT